MALNFCSDLVPFQTYNNYRELSSFSHNYHSDFVEPELLCGNDHRSYEELPVGTLLNPSFDPLDDPYQSDSYTNLLPFFSSSENMVSLTPGIFPTQDFDCYQQPPKRLKMRSCEIDYNYQSNLPSLFEEYCIGNTKLVRGLLPGIPASEAPDFQASTVFNFGVRENVKKQNHVCLSAQSVAARERRRKITEKTQELGKLIPGGNKMNTAEMFQAASKYVKFLQAQVSILQLMNSIQERLQESLNGREMQALLASTRIQEKLYSEEKCLVPSEPLIIEQIDRLLAIDAGVNDLLGD